jgi:hypothetical protein
VTKSKARCDHPVTVPVSSSQLPFVRISPAKDDASLGHGPRKRNMDQVERDLRAASDDIAQQHETLRNLVRHGEEKLLRHVKTASKRTLVRRRRSNTSLWQRLFGRKRLPEAVQLRHQSHNPRAEKRPYR